MSQNTGFISHKRITLEKDGTYRNENVTGQVFICSMASFIFEMQYNDGGWFDWDQGLQFNIAPDRFTKLAFRAKTFTEDTQVAQREIKRRLKNTVKKLSLLNPLIKEAVSEVVSKVGSENLDSDEIKETVGQHPALNLVKGVERTAAAILDGVGGLIRGERAERGHL